MSVSYNIIKNGEIIDSKLIAGLSIGKVIEHLKDKNIPYSIDGGIEKAYERTKDEDITLIVLDDTNVLGVDGIVANFITEYTLEYDDLVFKELQKVLV